MSLVMDWDTVRIQFSHPISLVHLAEPGLFRVLECLCMSLQPFRVASHNISTAWYRLEHYSITQDGVRPSPPTRTDRLRLAMTCKTEPLYQTTQGCWQGLFGYCNIVQPSPATLNWKAFVSAETQNKDIRPSPRGFGKGLEMSFDLMVAMAAVEYPLVINGGVIFVGCQTALIPIKVNEQGDAVQFHLLTAAVDESDESWDKESGSGMFNPYRLDPTMDRLLTQDFKQFRSMRCFLGWRSSVQLNLGTPQLPAHVGYSGGRETKSSTVLDGVETLIQLGLSPGGPLSAVVGVQANYKYTSHQRRFTPMRGYATLLRDTAAKLVVVYDARQRRGWLVPMLSLLLHMAHAYVLNCVDGPVDNVPLVNGHADATELIAVLEPRGERPVFGHSTPPNTNTTTPSGNEPLSAQQQADRPLLLRQLLLGLRTNLFATTEATKPSASRTIHGFEFMDIVNAPDRGACMKTFDLPASSSSPAWFALANAADAVIVCANIGEVITPIVTRAGNRCDVLPQDEDYMAATVACLNRLARRRGSELPLGVVVNGAAHGAAPARVARISTAGKVGFGGHVKISEDELWELKGDPFVTCGHDGAAEDGTCWEKNQLLQRVRSTKAKSYKRWVRKMKISGKMRANIEGEDGRCQMEPLPKAGAVVFGIKERRRIFIAMLVATAFRHCRLQRLAKGAGI